MKSVKTKLAGVAATALLSTSVLAADTTTLSQGDIIVRFGAVQVNPSVDSGTPELGGVDIPSVAGGIDVNEDTQFGISGTYMLMDKLGIELLAATPFTHDITVKGGALDGMSIGDTTHLPPTLTLQFYPLGGTSYVVQPYLGVGVNYTIFYDNDVDRSIVAALGGTDGSLDIENSVGIAGQIGLDIYLTDHLLANVSYMYADIDADATVKTNNGQRLRVEADLDPGIYRVNLGYKF